MYSVSAGRATYGHGIGVIMQHDGCVRLPGDVGNLSTYSFPVTYKIVHDFPMAALQTDKLLDHAALFIEAARELESLGCKAITCGCGFMALLQPLLAKEVAVPVFTSALIQVPLVYSMLKRDMKVGLITSNSEQLTPAHYSAVGWTADDIPIAVAGVECTEFNEANFEAAGSDPLAYARIEAAIVSVASELVRQEPQVGAVVLECTNMPPFASAIQRAINKPVFDIVTLINMVHAAVTQTEFAGTY